MPVLQRGDSGFVSHELSRRDLAVDALRGLMMIGMILVNHPPGGAPVYPALAHAPWHGWTLADTIFPGFLFAVGMSIHFALGGPRDAAVAASRPVLGKVLRRFVLLLVISALLVNFPYYDPQRFHFTGALATIAWSYLIVAVVRLHAGPRMPVVLLVLVLVLQWALYTFVPVPGAGAGVMTPEGNAASHLERLAFAPLFGSAWTLDNDALVLLPLLGTVGTTLFGLLAAQWIERHRAGGVPVGALFAAGVVLFLAGGAWDSWLPVNKRLWTASYVLLMAGLSLQLLAALYLAVRRGFWPGVVEVLRIAGVNALVFYVFAQGLQRLLVFGRVHVGGGPRVPLRQIVYDCCVAPWGPGRFGSLVFALAFLLICYGFVYVLYRRRWFVKL